MANKKRFTFVEPDEVLCPYCEKPSQVVGGNVIYPHRSDLYRLNFWHCAPCEAYVGCHKGSKAPLGRLANAELRKAKKDAHDAFDPLWRLGGFSRDEAYLTLARAMQLDPKDCHIGMFDMDQCKKVIEISKDLKKSDPSYED